MTVVQLFNREARKFQEFDGLNHSYFEANMAAVRLFSLFVTIINFLAILSTALLIGPAATALRLTPRPGRSIPPASPLEIAAPYQPGSTRRVTVAVITADGTVLARTEADITAAEPGWTMWMVSHFHYDPVWWNTQGQFTESRLALPDEDGHVPDLRSAFELVGAHLDKARRDPDYTFVLAEIDYLKPYFDAFPQDREDLRRLVAQGRVELVCGNYHAPNTNPISAEPTIRTAVYGTPLPLDVFGRDPRSPWILAAFAHPPPYPWLFAAAAPPPSPSASARGRTTSRTRSTT